MIKSCGVGILGMNIILGSGSKSRRRILERLGLEFKIMTADIDEKVIRLDDPKQLVLALAKAKAEAILPRIKESAILITADQVVFCNGQIYEKPENAAQAREYLKSYAIHESEAINGLVVINTATGRRIEQVEASKIKFKPIPDSVIDKLIEEGNIFSQAGAYSVEDPLLAPYVEYIDGTLDSIEGLPSHLLSDLFKEVGG